MAPKWFFKDFRGSVPPVGEHDVRLGDTIHVFLPDSLTNNGNNATTIVISSVPPGQVGQAVGNSLEQTNRIITDRVQVDMPILDESAAVILDDEQDMDGNIGNLASEEESDASSVKKATEMLKGKKNG